MTETPRGISTGTAHTSREATWAAPAPAWAAAATTMTVHIPATLGQILWLAICNSRLSSRRNKVPQVQAPGAEGN
jgi:hypothetical protein